MSFFNKKTKLKRRYRLVYDRIVLLPNFTFLFIGHSYCKVTDILFNFYLIRFFYIVIFLLVPPFHTLPIPLPNTSLSNLCPLWIWFLTVSIPLFLQNYDKRFYESHTPFRVLFIVCILQTKHNYNRSFDENNHSSWYTDGTKYTEWTIHIIDNRILTLLKGGRTCPKKLK